MKSLSELQSLFEEQLSAFAFPTTPATLYEPMQYILSIGGKRIRPVLLLSAYNLFKEQVSEAFNAALAIEVFHNFSLLHDDIMDDADIRRGQPTVHIKYDENTAILSGDVMMIYAYKLLETYPDNFFALTQMFTDTSIGVCDGQRMDMDFETEKEVTIGDYLKMIELKTSVLIGAALGMGGILGGASSQDIKHLYEFGKNVGIAFQIQDDLLDTFGTEALLGKKIGGDIIQKKKTYLYLKALELLSKEESARLEKIFNDDSIEMDDNIVNEVKGLLKASHVSVHAQELKLVYQQLGLSHLAAVSVSEDKKQTLTGIAEYLLNRTV